MKRRLITNKHTFGVALVVSLTLPILTLLLITSSPQGARALSISDFEAGRIIDDTVFYNKDTMNVQQIQDFLDKLITSCDTWGTGPSEYGGGTRAQYAASVGWPAPPYVCINNYHENPTTHETSFEKGGGKFEGGISAANIIYNAAQTYGINPQVLLVLLKKESAGPITSDVWPLKTQYRYAMGYACPDSGPGFSADCDTSKAGLYNQVTLAAWQLKYYKDHPNDYRYKIGLNQIQYSPDPVCGVKDVHIENMATLSLYIYTPYTPNDGALANYPGQAPCGAYGNRNFFMFFKEWFGSPNYRPPVCNSRVPGVSCVWRLYDPMRQSDFLTINDQERDAAVRNSKYSYNEIAFYALSTPQPGSIPVYRIRLADRHFYTPNQSEVDILTQDSQNQFEGVAFYVYPSTYPGNTSYPTYRLTGERGHVLTSSADERDALLISGYTYEGTTFNTPSGFAVAPTPSQDHINIYRINNGTRHHYTSSLLERDELIRTGWTYEGILQESPLNPTTTPVYRLTTGKRHLFTTSDSEKNTLIQGGWVYEGVAWYTDFTTPPTYRFYIDGRQFYTSSLSEALSITNKGAIYEGVAFGHNQDTRTPVYRLNNSQGHFFTANINEVLSIQNKGWTYEGVAWYSSPNTNGTPIYRLKGTSSHIYTASEQEKNALVQSGWAYEGIAWYADTATPQTYRFYINGRHFYTADLSEALRITNKGAVYEGVAFGQQQGTANPIYRLYDGRNHFYTANINEVLSIHNRGWTYEGIGWYGGTGSDSPPVYRLKGPYHFYTSSDAEKSALTQSGWTYEGIAW